MYNQHSGVASVQQFMYKVYGWMMAALSITAFTAYYVASTPQVLNAIFSTPFLGYGILIAQIGLVVALSALINRISFATAVGLFVAYSVLVGITFSSIFIVFEIGSIYSTFIITAGMFATMALYGYFTKSDLTSVGSFAMMGLFGLIIAMVVNMFIQSDAFSYVLSLLGVGIFTLLTAYDMQKIKQLGTSLMYRGESGSKIALMGALTLYLDFINLFIRLLQLLGKRRK